MLMDCGSRGPCTGVWDVAAREGREEVNGKLHRNGLFLCGDDLSTKDQTRDQDAQFSPSEKSLRPNLRS